MSGLAQLVVRDPAPARCKHCSIDYPFAPRDWRCGKCQAILWETARTKCAVCAADFSVWTWEHHCRRCSRTTCSRCSSATAMFPVWGDTEPRRICSDCCATLQGAAPPGQSPPVRQILGAAVASPAAAGVAAVSSSLAAIPAVASSAAAARPTGSHFSGRQPATAAAAASSSKNQKQVRQAGFDMHRILQEATKNYDILALCKELLQNSDDAGSSSVTFVLDNHGCLWHFQDGALSHDDFAALGKFYSATKIQNFSKIGRFGLGFCSCFVVTDLPRVQSAGRQWEMSLETLDVEETDVLTAQDEKQAAEDEAAEKTAAERAVLREQRKKERAERTEKRQSLIESVESRKRIKSKRQHQDPAADLDVDGDEDDADGNKEQQPEQETKDDDDVVALAKEDEARKKDELEAKDDELEEQQAQKLAEERQLRADERALKAAPVHFGQPGSPVPIAGLETGAIFCFPFRTVPLFISDIVVFDKTPTDVAEAAFLSVLRAPSSLLFLNNVKQIRLFSIAPGGAITEKVHHRLEQRSGDSLKEFVAIKAQLRRSLEEARSMPYAETKSIQVTTLVKPRTVPPLAHKKKNKDDDDEQQSVTAETAAATSTESTTHPWWYCCEAHLPFGQLGSGATANERLANEPVVTQLAAPISDCADPDALFAVGLPLTGTRTPLLCHASANLDLDATRINIRHDSKRNAIAQQVLVKRYVDNFLPMINPYVNCDSVNAWPCRLSDVTDRFMSDMARRVFEAVARSSLFGVLFETDKKTLTALPNVVFLPDKEKAESAQGGNCYGVYQRIAMAAWERAKDQFKQQQQQQQKQQQQQSASSRSSSASSWFSLGGGGNKNQQQLPSEPQPPIPLISHLADSVQQHFLRVVSSSLPFASSQFVIESLRRVDPAALDRAQVTDEERLMLLRWILNSSQNRSARALAGLPLRHTTRGWSRFASSSSSSGQQQEQQWTFFSDDKSSVHQLLPSPATDCIASKEMTALFRAISVPDVCFDLELTHLLADESKLLKRQLEHVATTGAGDAEQRQAAFVGFLGNFWRFVQTSVAKNGRGAAQITSRLQAMLDALPLLAVTISTSSPSSPPPQQQQNSEKKNTSTSTFRCLNVSQLNQTLIILLSPGSSSSVSSEMTAILTQKLEVPVVHKELLPALLVHPASAECKLESFPHVVRLLASRASNSPALWARLSSENLSTVRTHVLEHRLSLEQHKGRLGNLVRCLPIFRQLSGFEEEGEEAQAGSPAAAAHQLQQQQQDQQLSQKKKDDDEQQQRKIHHHTTLDHRGAKFCDEALFSSLPSFAQQGVLVAVPATIARALSLSLENMDSVVRSTLLGAGWLKMTPTDKLSVFDWVVSSKRAIELVPDMRVPLLSSGVSASSSSASGRVADLYIIADDKLDDPMVCLCQKYCPERFARVSGSPLKRIVDEALRLRVCKATNMDTPLLVETMKRIVATALSNMKKSGGGGGFVHVQVGVSEKPSKIWSLLPLEVFGDVMISVRELFFFPHLMAKVEEEKIPFVVAVRHQQQQQQPSHSSSSSNHRELRLELCCPAHAYSHFFYELVGNDALIALPPPAPHDRHETSRYGKRSIADAAGAVALALRWRQLLSMRWPTCPQDCACRGGGGGATSSSAAANNSNHTVSESLRHVVFLISVIENEIVSIVRTTSQQQQQSVATDIAHRIHAILPRDLRFLVVPGRPHGALCFESPQNCVSGSDDRFAPLVPSIGNDVLARLFSISSEFRVSPDNVSRVLLPWAGHLLPHRAVVPLFRLIVSCLHGHQRQLNSHQQQYPLKSYALLLPSTGLRMMRASELIFVPGIDDTTATVGTAGSSAASLLGGGGGSSAGSSLAAVLCKDDSLPVLHGHFCRLGASRCCASLGVRHFRDLQRPIKEFVEDPAQRALAERYQRRLRSPFFAEVIELLIAESSMTDSTLELETSKEKSEMYAQSVMRAVARAKEQLRYTEVALVSDLRVSWQLDQKSNNSSSIKTIINPPFAIEPYQRKSVAGVRYFILTRRLIEGLGSSSSKDGGGSGGAGGESTLTISCDEEELRSTLADCLVEQLGGLDEKVSKKLTWWLRRDEKELEAWSRRRASDAQKQDEQEDVVTVLPQATNKSVTAKKVDDDEHSDKTAPTSKALAAVAAASVPQQQHQSSQEPKSEKQPDAASSSVAAANNKLDTRLAPPPPQPSSSSLPTKQQQQQQPSSSPPAVAGTIVNENDSSGDQSNVVTGTVLPQQQQQHQQQPSVSAGAGAAPPDAPPSGRSGGDGERPVDRGRPVSTDLSGGVDSIAAQKQHQQQHGGGTFEQPLTLDEAWKRPSYEVRYPSAGAAMPQKVPADRSAVDDGGGSGSNSSNGPVEEIRQTHTCQSIDDLELWREQRPGCVKVYVSRGHALPASYRGRNVWDAVVELSQLLREFSALVDPNIIHFCGVFFAHGPSSTLAFNLSGMIYFSLSFFIRDPDREGWLGTFIHELAHNHSDNGHDLNFVKALQGIFAQVLMRETRRSGGGGALVASSHAAAAASSSSPSRPAQQQLQQKGVLGSMFSNFFGK